MANFSYSNSTKEQRPNPFNDAEWEGYRGSGSPPGSHFASSLQTPPASTCHDSHSDHTEIGTRRLSSYGAQSTLTDSPGYAKRVQSVAPDPGMWKLALSQGERNRNVPTPTYTAGVVTRGEEYRSPSESHSDQGLRRKPSMREFSAEVDGGPKRQKDKGHQKDRRKAPKVAAAYRLVPFYMFAVCFSYSDPEQPALVIIPRIFPISRRNCPTLKTYQSFECCSHSRDNCTCETFFVNSLWISICAFSARSAVQDQPT